MKGKEVAPLCLQRTPRFIFFNRQERRDREENIDLDNLGIATRIGIIEMK